MIPGGRKGRFDYIVAFDQLSVSSLRSKSQSECLTGYKVLQDVISVAMQLQLPTCTAMLNTVLLFCK